MSEPFTPSHRNIWRHVNPEKWATPPSANPNAASSQGAQVSNVHSPEVARRDRAQRASRRAQERAAISQYQSQLYLPQSSSPVMARRTTSSPLAFDIPAAPIIKTDTPPTPSHAQKTAKPEAENLAGINVLAVAAMTRSIPRDVSGPEVDQAIYALQQAIIELGRISPSGTPPSLLPETASQSTTKVKANTATEPEASKVNAKVAVQGAGTDPGNAVSLAPHLRVFPSVIAHNLTHQCS